MRPVLLARRVLTILFVGLLLSAAGLVLVRVQPAGDTATASAPPTPTVVPTPTALRGAASMLTTLSPDDVVLQLDYEPTFSTPEAFQPFGRLPVLTVFADGRSIYLDGVGQRQAMEVRLTAADITALLDQVYQLGFGRLESHPDQCRRHADGTGECTADASYSVIRARLPNGTLRTVRNYHTYANDPTALAAIRDLLGTFRHPATAQVFRPERATLFLGQVYGDDSAVTYQPWPLAAARLEPPQPQQTTWAIVVTSDEWDALVRDVGAELGQRFVELNGRRYAAYLIPWLPYVDYTADVAAFGDPLPAPSEPAAAPP